MALIAILAATRAPVSPADAPAQPSATPAPAASSENPAPGSLPRVPGTRLRLGMPESKVLALGAFTEIQAPDAGDMTARRAPARFFGVPGEATCYLRDGVLAEVRFEAGGVGTHSQDYVDGQLRLSGFTRVCRPDLTGNRTCDWTAPEIRLHTEMSKDRLTAHAFRWPPPGNRAADSLPAGAKAPAGRTGAASSAATSTGGAAKTQAPPRAPGALGAQSTSSAPSGGAQPASGTGPGAPAAAAGGAAATAGASHASGATTAPARDSVAHAAAVVATLPETLTITPASRNSPTAWPRIVSSPPLQYPDKAKQESLQGVVWVCARVDTSGKVMNASIEHGIRELNDAALAWVRGSEFAPCVRNGAPCRFVVRVAVLFTLY